MIATVQRVDNAAVSVENIVVGSIEKGLLVLLGVFGHDSERDCEILAQKVAALRIFCDENDKMNRSVLDVDGEILLISNFTLCADTKKGNRPSFTNAKAPSEAQRLYEYFMECLKAEGVTVESGRFGADMDISAKLQGPITINLDTVQWRKE